MGTEEYELANGEIVEEEIYLGKVVFDHEPKYVIGLSNRSTDLLIGTKLLENKILTIDFKNNEVTVEK